MQMVKRRVLLIDLGPQFGGIGTYLVSLADLLASDVDLYALCVLPELSARLTSSGAKVIRLPVFCGTIQAAALSGDSDCCSVAAAALRHPYGTTQWLS